MIGVSSIWRITLGFFIKNFPHQMQLFSALSVKISTCMIPHIHNRTHTHTLTAKTYPFLKILLPVHLSLHKSFQCFFGWLKNECHSRLMNYELNWDRKCLFWGAGWPLIRYVRHFCAGTNIIRKAALNLADYTLEMPLHIHIVEHIFQCCFFWVIYRGVNILDE